MVRSLHNERKNVWSLFCQKESTRTENNQNNNTDKSMVENKMSERARLLRHTHTHTHTIWHESERARPLDAGKANQVKKK